jgi:5-methyltetrahydrofolate--homocysteine methyltransferase
VGVVKRLLDGEGRAELAVETGERYERLREEHLERQGQRLLTLAEARARRVEVDWSTYEPPPVARPGIHAFDAYPVAELEQTIDWTMFLKTWKLPGTYPRALEGPKGEEHRRVLGDARELLQRLAAERLVRPRAVVGFWPANATGDDIELYADEGRGEVLAVLHHLRQQREGPGGKPRACLADFVAPQETGLPDHVGAFVVTAGPEIAELAERFAADGDDYRAIMMRVLGDRLAESFAERMHQLVRTELWGYASAERLSNEDLIRERYVGIRPAPGYPACPDHTEKATLFALLDATARTGVRLTESFAMAPASSVSGWYIAHPASRYFAVGKIGRDQVADAARRKGMPLAELERWLAPYLDYSPAGE